ncbi:hypothetical protein B5X24_HaOG204456 [Helicoverpa armigera]|uniref:Uncharacterized protein n=1 Tax=Helicoverpa armigera TaxID=29058 RepID=A0A2W1BTM6_HELAM|nr:hypothetical protein B5X24_HaOG204456 [Helicoverpa armigera]
MKPVCGSVKFPDYSCQELHALQTKQTSFEDTSLLELEESTLRPIYGLSEHVSQSSLLSSDGPPHVLQDVTDVPPAYGKKTVLAAVPHESSWSFEAFVTESLPSSFDKISKVASVQNTGSKTQALGRVTTQNIVHETKDPSYYSSTWKPVHGRSALRENKVVILQKVIVTKSTYPFYPDGTTPEKVPEGVKVDICHLAKCMKMDWKDPTEKKTDQKPNNPLRPGRPSKEKLQLIQFRGVSTGTTKKTETGVESPPLQYADDAYYFEEGLL